MSGEGSDDDTDKRFSQLLADLAPLGEALVGVWAQAKAVGVFTGERGLIECGCCGLRENVLAGGTLIVDSAGRPSEDSGLRFTPAPAEPEQFGCPRCGALALPEP